MISLTTASTQQKGWDDFVIDLAEFAEKWGGTPLDQSVTSPARRECYSDILAPPGLLSSHAT